ncbi:hypothetical protein FF011L_01070 [Roseimaritima multifibrata]|uniref:Uncharacterized protein n=1 Tax=Roseimaritima multifibrata TaxID=1930274 RepID=A0A517M906_9BACT|nr:hypothetical protein [Roseimaritima multifibrata]QDS91378.1 hypothetical protein FF011L_01070 [Roseimaritima multifibrata]
MHSHSLSTEPSNQSGQPDRWALWVDGAGGFLLITSLSATIGGPASDDEAMIAVQADLRRREALITRSNGQYQVQAVDGRVAPSASASGNRESASPQAVVSLRPEDSFVLGDGVPFKFRLPNPLSGSARLTVDRRYRFRSHVDAILLIDDTLVIGPSADCHIQVPHAAGKLVLMPKENAWQIKPAVAGTQWQNLQCGTRWHDFDLSMTLEKL